MVIVRILTYWISSAIIVGRGRGRRESPSISSKVSIVRRFETIRSGAYPNDRFTTISISSTLTLEPEIHPTHSLLTLEIHHDLSSSSSFSDVDASSPDVRVKPRKQTLSHRLSSSSSHFLLLLRLSIYLSRSSSFEFWLPSALRQIRDPPWVSRMNLNGECPSSADSFNSLPPSYVLSYTIRHPSIRSVLYIAPLF